MDQSRDTRFGVLSVGLVIFAVIARLIPHVPNVAPISALALFGASYLPKRWALGLPITALLISDAIIGFYGPTMIAVYGSFVLVGLIGLWVRSHRSVATVISASLAGSILFFLITNAAVWLDPVAGYAPGLPGLLASYAAGLSFFRNTLVGDLGYTGLFFGGYELARAAARRYLVPRIADLLAA